MLFLCPKLWYNYINGGEIMNNDNFLKNLDNEVTAFYKNEGNKIYNDIINKYNNNIINGEQVIYLLKWCCNYFKRYYIDDWTHWSSSYISEFIDNTFFFFSATMGNWQMLLAHYRGHTLH